MSSRRVSPHFATVCAIARRIRYRTLDRVIGEKVRIAAEPSAVGDVLDALDRFLPPVAPPLPQPAPGLGAVAKHGLLDLEFSLRAGAGADLPRLSVRELRALGVLLKNDTAHEPEEEDLDFSCLTDLHDQVTSGKVVLKLILDAVNDDRPISQRLIHTMKGLPGNYLPRQFRVRDACVTNAPSLWLQKHFYL